MDFNYSLLDAKTRRKEKKRKDLKITWINKYSFLLSL